MHTFKRFHRVLTKQQQQQKKKDNSAAFLLFGFLYAV